MQARLNEDFSTCPSGRYRAILQGISATPHDSPQVWKVCGSQRPHTPLSTAFRSRIGLWTTGRANRSGYTRPPAGDTPAPFLLFGRDETDLSAERTQAEAQARLPRADVDARRSHDPQAPPRQGPQAPLGVTPVQRAEPPLPLSRLRRRLPAGPVRLDALPDALLVPARGAGRRAAARVRRAEGGRQRRRPQPDQAPAARDRARRGSRPSRRRTTTCSSSARACRRPPRRTGTTGSPSASTRCSGRRPHDRSSGASPILPIRLYQLLVSPLAAGEHLQVPPELLRVRGARDPQARRRCKGSPLAGWRLLRCNPWSHGGVDYP